MRFTINRNIVFIDIMQFMKSSLDSSVKNLVDTDFISIYLKSVVIRYQDIVLILLINMK